MSQSARLQPIAPPRSPLGLYSPPPSESHVAYWKINGYRAAIVVWTAEEWEKLPSRPSDAQYYPCGVWCALRLE